MPQAHDETIDQIIADVLQVDVDEFDDETVFGTDLEADSLDYVEIAETIEFDIGVHIPDEDLEAIETVGDVKAFVADRQ